MPSIFDRQTLSTLLLATFTVACSADDSLDDLEVELRESEPVPAEQRSGSVLVEYNSLQSNGVSVTGQFMEVSGISMEAAFDALDIWSPDSELDLDACSIRVPPSAGEEAEQIRLHMLDVGPIAVSALDHSIRLEGRRVPDLRSFSGVVYGNEEGFDFDEAFLPFQQQARYHIVAPGGVEAGGFHVSLTAPAVPEIDSITGRYTVDAEPIDLRGDELELHWSPVGDETTSLYLEVTAPSSTQASLRCHVEDDGHFVVPASVLEQLGDGTMQLTLRRIDAVRFPVDGVEDGSFIFAATSEAAIRR